MAISFTHIPHPRYADQPHVVYEHDNEPDDYVNITRICNTAIRKHAPQTHQLLLSPSNIEAGVKELLTPIAVFKDEIDWSNASIAYHGYGTSGDFQKQAIKTMNDSGYAMTCTEFWPNTGLEPAYESAGMSYFHLIWCSIIYGRGIEATCDRVKPLTISYVPDFGSWPQPHIDYSTLAAWQPWTEENYRGAATACRLVVGSIPWANARTVYDLSGRTLWRRQGSGTEYGGAQLGRVLPWPNSRALVVDYGDK